MAMMNGLLPIRRSLAPQAGMFGWVDTGVDTDMLAQRMLDVSLQCVRMPAAKHAATMKVGACRVAVGPVMASFARTLGECVAAIQADDVGQGHQADHCGGEQDGIEQYSARERMWCAREHEAADDAAEAVSDGMHGDIAEHAASCVPGLQAEFCRPIPAQEASAMIAVAMALDI
mgnify:CR=1 FL=1